MNCSQKLDGYSLARARKMFATACQMLVLAKINTLLACAQRPFYTHNFLGERDWKYNK